MPGIDLRALVANHLVERMSAATGYVLSIAGAGCTGKSTFALELADRLRALGVEAAVLDLDGYFLSRAERARAGLSAYHPEAFDLERARTDVARLMDRHVVPVRVYDKISGTSCDAGVVEPGECLVVEGAMALHETLLGFPSFRLFLDASSETLFENRRRRERGFGFDDAGIMRKFAGLQHDYATYILPQGAKADLRIQTDGHYRFTALEAS